MKDIVYKKCFPLKKQQGWKLFTIHLGKVAKTRPLRYFQQNKQKQTVQICTM